MLVTFLAQLGATGGRRQEDTENHRPGISYEHPWRQLHITNLPILAATVVIRVTAAIPVDRSTALS
jgi:hypothetical protein